MRTGAAPIQACEKHISNLAPGQPAAAVLNAKVAMVAVPPEVRYGFLFKVFLTGVLCAADAVNGVPGEQMRARVRRLVGPRARWRRR